jgi:sirohydrochlorin cobaltochelatase
MTRQGLLLIAHGARDPAWARPFEAVAARIAERSPHCVLRIAYLEHLSPNIDAASGALVREGCQRVDVVPMFLGAGGHVQRDVPQAVEALTRRHPQVSFVLHPTIGEVTAVIEAMAASVVEASAADPVARVATPASTPGRAAR